MRWIWILGKKNLHWKFTAKFTAKLRSWNIMGPLSHSGGKSVCNSYMDWVDCQSIRECILVGDLRILGGESNLSNVPVGLEVVAATCGSLLFWHGNGISIWWLVSTKYNNQEIRIQLVGWHYILRWDHAFSYASVAIGSLVDLEQDLYCYIHYTIYCKWNVRLLNACGYDGY